MNRCAFLMSSCDKYEDLWDPFFECLDKIGKLGNIPVYLNTEHKKFIPSTKLSFDVITLNQKESHNISWSKRFIQILNNIPQDYVFLVLDDFFVCESIKLDCFKDIIDIMEKDKSIASFQLYGTRIRNKSPEDYDNSQQINFHLINENGWKTHFVPTIWRKSVLLKWLRPWESIWAFEGYGSERARRWKYPEKVYIVNNPPIYDYLWINDCSSVINGKWLDEPELFKFFNDNNIQIDFAERGKMTLQEYNDVTMKDIIKKYSLKQIIIKIFNRIRSYF